MSIEIEAAAADSVGGFFRRKPRHQIPVGTPCPNCETPLEGPYCHACGQKAEDYHRSIVKLAYESVEGLFEMDGRMFRTIPELILRPGKLTRAYLEGHRVPQIPPFRLFLIVIVIVFFAGGLGGKKHNTVVANQATSEARAEAKADLAKEGIDIDVPGVRIQAGDKGVGTRDGTVNGKPVTTMVDSNDMPKDPVGRWIVGNMAGVQDNQDAFVDSMVEWGHRLAILTLPMSAAILGLLFVFRRKFYIFDHLIFSMHSLSFLGLLVSAIMTLEHFTGSGGWWAFILAAPVHLFIHMRGVYERGRITTLLRMFVLFMASSVGVGMIMLAVAILGAMDVGGRNKPAKPDAPTDAAVSAAATRDAVKEAIAAAKAAKAAEHKAAKPPPKPQKPKDPAEPKTKS